jgi:hypothetical protein
MPDVILYDTSRGWRLIIESVMRHGPCASTRISQLLPHFCAEADLHNLLKRFAILKLFEALKPAKPTRDDGLVGQWIVWAHKDKKSKGQV